MKKIIFTVLVFGLISIIPSSFSQLSVADSAIQKSVIVTIDKENNVQVEHNIRSSEEPRQLDFISGNISNISGIDGKGKYAPHTEIVTNNAVMIFPNNEDVKIEYELEDALILKNGVWTWDFTYLETTIFVFPENLDLVYINSRPVSLQDSNKIKCHGCQIVLEYVIDEPTTVYEVDWEGQKFDVELRSLAEINSFEFDQPSKSISINVNDSDRIITLDIPRELLWNPYEVFLNEEKIWEIEHSNDDSHVSLTFRPETLGTVEIVGTSVVPEFSILTPLVFGLAMMIPILARKKINLR